MSKIGDILNKDVGSFASRVLKADVGNIVMGAGRALNTDVGSIAKGTGKVLAYDLGELFTDAAPGVKPATPAAPAAHAPIDSNSEMLIGEAASPVAADTEHGTNASTGNFRPVAAATAGNGANEPPKARLTEALVNRQRLSEPAGADLLGLLPVQLANYARDKGEALGDIASDPVNVTYSGNGEAVSVVVVSCWDADEARDKLERDRLKLENSRGSTEHCWVAGIDSRGVVFLWTRNHYCFEVVSPRGVSPIARFLGEFPY